MPLIPSRTHLLLALLLAALPGCALYNASQDDPDAGDGFDLAEADMSPDMSDPLDMEDMLDMNTPDMDMGADMRDMAEMPVDMPVDMPPTCKPLAALLPTMTSCAQAPDMGDDMSDDMSDDMDVAPRAALQVVTGQDFSCALLSDQSVRCWGKNDYKQLGYPDSPTNTTKPTSGVEGLATPIQEITAGAFHACALSAGKVYCWGRNDYGQRGDGTTQDQVASVGGATSVAGLSQITQISAGEQYTCALNESGAVYCWGRNQHAQLGRDSVGTFSQAFATPGLVQNLPGPVKKISAGENKVCAVLLDDRVTCWGRNESGESGAQVNGNGSGNFAIKRPVIVPELDQVFDVSAGKELTCAVRGAACPEGQVFCWGNDRNSARNGSCAKNFEPVPFGNFSSPSTIHVGLTSACVVLGNMDARCWSYGAPPIVIQNNVVQMDIDPNGEHACAVTTDRDIFCWGKNSNGQLGDGNTSNASTNVPVKVLLP